MTYEELKKKVKSYRQEDEEQPESEEKSKSYDDLKKEVKQYRLQEDVKKVDDSYIDRFFDNADSFLERASNESIGFDNASNILRRYQTDYESLNQQRELINSWVQANRDLLDDSTYQSYLKELDKYRTDSVRVMHELSKAKDYYDPEKNREEYQEYLDYQNAQAEHDRILNYDVEAGDKKIKTLEQLSDDTKKDQDVLDNWVAQWGDEAIPADVQAEMDIIQNRINDRIAQSGITDIPEGMSIEEYLANERAKHHQSKMTKKEYEMTSVVNDSDFEEYSTKGAEMQNPSYKDANGWGYIFGWRPGSDEVKNKVAFARENAEILQDELTNQHKNNDTPFVVDPIYRHVTDEEASVYNYYLAKYGAEKADEYLEVLEDKLNQREAGKVAEFLSGNTFAEIMYGANVGADQFKSGMKGVWKSLFSDDDYIAPSAIQYAGQAVRQDLEDNGPKIFGNSLAQIGYDTLSTTANMAPSILASYAVGMLNPVAGGVVGKGLLGASAAGNAYMDKLNKGYSKDQARAYGYLVGASEILLESALGGISAYGGSLLSNSSIRLLNRIDNVLGDFARTAGGKLLVNATSEAIEEGVQSILEPYIWMAVSGEEANVDWEETLYSALLGFATGGLFEAAPAVGTWSANANAKKTYGPNQSALVNSVLELEPNSKYAQSMQSKLDKGKNLSGVQLGHLTDIQTEAVRKRARTQLASEAKAKLAEYGEAGDVTVLSEALAKQALGEELTRAEKKAIAKSEYGKTVAGDLKVLIEDSETGADVAVDNTEAEVAEDVASESLNAEEYAEIVKNAEAEVKSTDVRAMEAVSAESESASVEDVLGGTAEEVSAESKDVTEVATEESADWSEQREGESDDAYYDRMLGLDGGKNSSESQMSEADSVNGGRDADVSGDADSSVSVEETAPESAEDVSASLEKASKKYGKQAKAMMATYDQGQNVAMFDSAYSVAYEMGKVDPELLEYAMNSEATKYLTPEQREHAFKAGVAASNPDVIGGKSEKSSGKSKKSGKTVRKKGTVTGKDVKIADLEKTFNVPQRQAYKVLCAIAEVTGINIVLTKSTEDAQGRLVGNQGEFDWSNDTITIDINAGISYGKDLGEVTKYIMLRTFSHEFTHFSEKYAPTEYKDLRNLVFKELKAKGVNVDESIQKKMDEYKDENADYDIASREVVADAMSDMIRDAHFVEKLARENKSLFKKIVAKFKEFLANIKSYFDGLGRNSSADARALQERIGGTVKYGESLVEMFDRMALAAVENYQNRAGGFEVESTKETAKAEPVQETAPEVESVQEAESAVAEETEQETVAEVENAQETVDAQEEAEEIEAVREKTEEIKSAFRKFIDEVVECIKYIFDWEAIRKDWETYKKEYKRWKQWKADLEALEKRIEDFDRMLDEWQAHLDEWKASLDRAERGLQEAKDALEEADKICKMAWEALDLVDDSMYEDLEDLYQRIIDDDLSGMKEASERIKGKWQILNDISNSELLATGAEQNGDGVVSELTPDQEGVVVNKDGEPVARSTKDGTVMLSIRTYEKEGRSAFRTYLEKCVKNQSLTKEEMQEMMDGIEDIYNTCKEFKDKYAPFSAWSDAEVIRDTRGKPVFSVVTPNGEYKMNLDFSLVCKKRRALDAVFNEMSKRGIIDDFELGPKTIVKINELIRKHGFETACALCFVDAKRFRQADVADSVVRLYNELVQSLVPEEHSRSIDYFNFAGYGTIKPTENGIHTWPNSELDFSHINEVLKKYEKGTVEAKAARYIKNNPEARRLLLRGDFMSSAGFDAVKSQNQNIMKIYNSKKGTGGPKAAFGDVQYMNEIISKNKSWTPEKAYDVGGVRIQSFSDYVPRMVFDYVQMIYDLAAKKLPAHAYTKEALFVKQFGLTGIKINMSLIPAIVEGGIAPGLDANGEYAWAGESFDFDTAKEIQKANGYSENCGTIAVGVSYEHIMKLLGDPEIRMVIPYHKSSLNPIVAHMNRIGKYTDYTKAGKTPVEHGGQRTTNKDGKTIEHEFNFAKTLHEVGDPKAVADQYLAWCDKNGYTPKFDEFKGHENYYKLLTDFTVYDASGNYVAQREVKAVFPKEGNEFGAMRDLIEEGLEEDAIIEGRRKSKMSEMVDEIERSIPGTEAEIPDDEQVEQADHDLEAELMDENRVQKSIRTYEDDYAPTFYSQMEKVVSGMKQEKFGASSVVDMLRGRGVKAEEIKWSGIEAWLEGKKSVTKAELQEFIAGSMLQIEEDVLGDTEIPYSQEHLDQIAKYESERDIIVEQLKSEWKRIVGTDIPINYFGAGLESAVVNNLMLANSEKKGNTEIGYQYKAKRAALQRVIEDSDDYFGYDYAREAFREAVKDPKDFVNAYPMTAFEESVFKDFIKAKEAYAKVEGISIEDQKALKAIAESADRFSNRIVDVKNKHRSEAAKHLSKYRAYTIKGGTNYRELLFRIPESNYSNGAMYAHWERSGVLAHARIQDINTFLGKMLFIEEIQSDWHNEGRKTGYEGVPDAPFRDNYHEFVLKKLIRMAAEQGYDSIGWTPAEIQSERWSDEFAEGYRIEYDQDIPKFLNKYGKKWDTKVGKTVLDSGTEVWSMAITDAMKDSVLYEGQAQYQKRTNTLTDHEILDMAAKELDTAKLTDGEKAALEIFRKKNDALKALKDERQKQGSLYYQYQFGDQKDTAKATAARNRMTVLDGKITKASAEVLGIEDKKVLKDVLRKSRKVIEQHERKASVERVRAAREEARAKEKQIANEKLEALRQKKNERIAEVRAEERQKAQEKLDNLREKKNERIAEVRAEERERAAERVQTVREGYQSSRLREKIKAFKAKLEKNLLNPTERQYVPAGLTQAMIDVVNLIDIDTDLINEDGTVNKAQERRDRTKMKLSDLAAEYERLKAADPVYAGEFDETVYSYLTELRDNFAGRHLSEMTLGELEEMYDILRSIEETLQDARKLIGWGDAETVYEAGDAIIAEQNAITAKRKDGKRTWRQEKRDNTLALTLAPVRFVERMSGYNQNSFLLKMFKAFEKGVRKKNMFRMEAYKSFEALTTGKEYEDALYTPFGKTYTDANGRSFRLSKMQMMQAILSMEREQANNMSHIAGSGFSFADLAMLEKGKMGDAISEEYSHRVPNATAMVGEFVALLKNDKWAQDYMAAARKFFNETAKDAVNETTLALKHRIVAKDKSYIPFEVDRNFIVSEISAANDVQQTINSYGMLKDTKQFASNPLIITGLNNILDRHIEQVGNLYGLAIDVRNFNKVWNVRGLEAGNGDPTVKAIIEKNWGKQGKKLVEQAVQDIQGPRQNTQSDLYKKVKSGYIGATFLLNLSVVTKQIGSLFSATSMLGWRGPVRQIGNLIYTMANSKKISAEVDKYTASAWMRRQGLSDAEVYTLMTEGKRTFAGRVADKLPTAINPTKWITAMDHAVALSLWKYAKEDVAKRTGLKGEALLKATAEFYDEVVENTQSMTDALHRPEIQKRSDVLSESLGMFKTDLYQMAGQLLVSKERYEANKNSENGKALARTAYSAVMSAVWAQLMTTAFALIRYKVNQYRDDEDEDLTAESWLKRQSFSLAGDLVGYIFPLVGSELVGFFENIIYDESEEVVDSLALTAINDLWDTATTIGSSLKDGEMPKTSDLRKVTAKALQIFGIPANNILRIIDAVQLHAEDIANGEFLSFEAGVERSSGQHAHRIMEAMQNGTGELAKALFDEAVEEAALKKSTDGVVSEEALKSAMSSLQTAFGKKYKAGEFDAEMAEKILTELFGESEDDAYWTIRAWDTGGESKYSNVFDAALSGTGFDEALKEMTDHGYEKDDVLSRLKTQVKTWYTDEESEVRISKQEATEMLRKYVGMKPDEVTSTINQWSSKVVTGIAYEDIKDEFLAGNMTASRAIDMRVRYGGKSKADATAEVTAWNAEKKYGLSSDIAKAYTKTIEHLGKSAEQVGIKADVFTRYKELCKTAGSKKEDIMGVIHSLPLTKAQKDALYYLNGWSENTIDEAPWH